MAKRNDAGGFLCDKFSKDCVNLSPSTAVSRLNISSLRNWFHEQKRDLPWRQTRDPYAIWVSEIMLQQTQVSVVIPYFLKWMEKYPTIGKLAAAPLDEVIKTWEGLGYYSRVRNLHMGAKFLVEHQNGLLPDSEDQLIKIKGLGPYTIGAILSFAFHQKKAAVDGNVIRVLTRYFGIDEDISKNSTVNKLRGLMQQLLPDDEPWVINEALIELGAMICQKKGKCTQCPLQKNCSSRINGQVDRLPFNSKKIKVERLYRSVVVIQAGDSFLLKKGEKGKLMSDLYEFPYFEEEKGFLTEAISEKVGKHLGLHVEQKGYLKEVKQSFTRYQAHLTPILYHCEHPKEIEGYTWIFNCDLKKLPFSSGHRKILHQLIDA